MKAPAEIMKSYCEVSKAKAGFSAKKTVILGFLAGAYIAMACFFYLVLTQDLAQYSGVGANKFLGAALFVTALVLIIFAGGELFTGNCLISIGWLSGGIKLRSVLRNWTLVYFSNMIGAVLVSCMIYHTGLVTLPVGLNGLQAAVAKVNAPFAQILLRAIFCNWLVALAVWISTAADEAAGKIALMWFPITMFVTCGYEHCVANMYYLSFGLFIKGGSPEIAAAAGIDPAQIANLDLYGYCFRNLLPATLGNIIGAVVFIALFYFMAYRDIFSALPALPENKKP